MAKKRKMTPDERAAIEEIRRTFTADDLAKMFQPTPTVPLRDVITELEVELAKRTATKKKRNSRQSRKKSA